MPLQDLRSQEVLSALHDFKGAQRFMQLYFKLPKFKHCIDKYPAAMDTVYQLRKKLEIDLKPGMLMDDIILHIAREWMSPLLDPDERIIIDETLGESAKILLTIAANNECRYKM